MIECETKSAAQAALFLFCNAMTAEGSHRNAEATCLPRIGVIAHQCYMVGMFPDSDQINSHRSAVRIVIDDHSRLPGRFFGRFTTGVAAALRKL
jgi:hypothetical protein